MARKRKTQDATCTLIFKPEPSRPGDPSDVEGVLKLLEATLRQHGFRYVSFKSRIRTYGASTTQATNTDKANRTDSANRQGQRRGKGKK